MNKRFLLLFVLCLLVFGLGKTLNAQDIYFCESVDENGKPVNPSDVFKIKEDGGSLYFLVRLDWEVNCTSVNYELYEIDENGKEVYSTTIEQDGMTESWTWFWKKVTFYKTGTYNIYVIDCNSEILTSAKLKIEFE